MRIVDERLRVARGRLAAARVARVAERAVGRTRAAHRGRGACRTGRGRSRGTRGASAGAAGAARAGTASQRSAREVRPSWMNVGDLRSRTRRCTGRDCSAGIRVSIDGRELGADARGVHAASGRAHPRRSRRGRPGTSAGTALRRGWLRSRTSSIPNRCRSPWQRRRRSSRTPSSRADECNGYSAGRRVSLQRVDAASAIIRCRSQRVVGSFGRSSRGGERDFQLLTAPM